MVAATQRGMLTSSRRDWHWSEAICGLRHINDLTLPDASTSLAKPAAVMFVPSLARPATL